MNEKERLLLRVAATQFGVLSRGQVLQHFTARQLERRLRNGAWERLFPRAYRVEGSTRCWRQRLKALSLSVEAGSALSHATAAALHGFRSFAEGPLIITTVRQVLLPAPVEVHRVSRLAPAALASVQGLRVTNVTRTLVDLAATESADQLRRAVDDALTRRWTTLERLSVATERAAGQRGVPALRALVDRYQGGDGPTESELELRMLELVEQARLPRPQSQRTVKVGGRVRRLDFLYPQQQLVIEGDGYAWHAGLEAFERDRQRNNSLLARGYAILHWTWTALHERPHELVKELRAVLDRRTSATR